MNVNSKEESAPSLKPPKKWFSEKLSEVKKGNPSYSDETASATVGKIWSDLSDAKKSEIREREGKTYGPAPKEGSLHVTASDDYYVVGYDENRQPKEKRPVEDFREAILYAKQRTQNTPKWAWCIYNGNRFVGEYGEEITEDTLKSIPMQNEGSLRVEAEESWIPTTEQLNQLKDALYQFIWPEEPTEYYGRDAGHPRGDVPGNIMNHLANYYNKLERFIEKNDLTHGEESVLYTDFISIKNALEEATKQYGIATPRKSSAIPEGSMAEKIKEHSSLQRIAANPIVEGMAQAFWATTWADKMEETGHSLSQMEITEVMPPVPPKAYQLGEELYSKIEQENSISLGSFTPPGEEHMDNSSWESFGWYLAMEAMGHGVSWKDDHEDHGLKIPYVEAYELEDDAEDAIDEEFGIGPRGIDANMQSEARLSQFTQNVIMTVCQDNPGKWPEEITDFVLSMYPRLNRAEVLRSVEDYMDIAIKEPITQSPTSLSFAEFFSHGRTKRVEAMKLRIEAQALPNQEPSTEAMFNPEDIELLISDTKEKMQSLTDIELFLESAQANNDMEAVKYYMETGQIPASYMQTVASRRAAMTDPVELAIRSAKRRNASTRVRAIDDYGELEDGEYELTKPDVSPEDYENRVSPYEKNLYTMNDPSASEQARINAAFWALRSLVHSSRTILDKFDHATVLPLLANAYPNELDFINRAFSNISGAMHDLEVELKGYADKTDPSQSSKLGIASAKLRIEAQADKSFSFPNLFSSEAKHWITTEVKRRAAEKARISASPEQTLAFIKQAAKEVADQMSQAVFSEIDAVINNETTQKIYDEISIPEETVQPQQPAPAPIAPVNPQQQPVEVPPLVEGASVHMPRALRVAFDHSAQHMRPLQPQIKKGTWVMIDGNAGNEWIPAEFVNLDEVRQLIDRLNTEQVDLRATGLKDFTKNSMAIDIDIVEGYGARLSALGYLDSTPYTAFDTEAEAYTVFDTEAEAEAFLKEQYGEDAFEEEASSMVG